jgi:hypothetical protein
VLLKIVYLLVRRILGLIVLLFRTDMTELARIAETTPTLVATGEYQRWYPALARYSSQPHDDIRTSIV